MLKCRRLVVKQSIAELAAFYEREKICENTEWVVDTPSTKLQNTYTQLLIYQIENITHH